MYLYSNIENPLAHTRRTARIINNSVKVLLVGTAENRYPIVEEEEFLDVPDLVNIYTGEINDFSNEPSDFEYNKLEIINNIRKVFGDNTLSESIKYMSVDPSYGLEKRIDTDDSNYLGHVSTLLENFETKIEFDAVMIVGCYIDFFNKKNIDKISELLKKRDGYLLIQDSVPYRIDKYFFTNFC